MRHGNLHALYRHADRSQKIATVVLIEYMMMYPPVSGIIRNAIAKLLVIAAYRVKGKVVKFEYFRKVCRIVFGHTALVVLQHVRDSRRLPSMVKGLSVIGQDNHRCSAGF